MTTGITSRTRRPDRSVARPVAIGPVYVGDHTVSARPCRLDDADAWRAVRMRNEHLIAPFWPRSARPWADRHGRNEWIRELLEARRDARAGHRVSFAIDVDGRFAGQCTLSSIDHRLKTAEVGVWIDSTVAQRAVGTIATGLVVDHGIARLGLRRIFAPTAVTNAAAHKALHRSRFQRACRLPNFYDIGSGGDKADEPVPHELWVLHATDLPDGGLTTLAIRSTVPDAAPFRAVDATRRVRGSRIRSTRLDDAFSVSRFHAGRLRGVWRARRRPSQFPQEVRVRLPAGPARQPLARPDDVALRLRRRPVGRTGHATASRTPTRSQPCAVLDTIRSGSWFGHDDGVTYDLHDDRQVVARLHLIGGTRGSGPAEIAAVTVNGRDPSRGRTVEATVAAVRALVSVAWSAGITAVATGTDPSDDTATAIALGAGFSRLGQLTDFAMREAGPGPVDVWTVNAP